jgi:hypothetical protein
MGTLKEVKIDVKEMYLSMLLGHLDEVNSLIQNSESLFMFTDESIEITKEIAKAKELASCLRLLLRNNEQTPIKEKQ